MPGLTYFPTSVGYASGTKFTAALLWKQVDDAIEEKLKPFDCNGEFPPPAPLWGAGTLDAITDNHDGTVTLAMSGVDWHIPAGFSGSRWVGYLPADPSLCYIPENYDVVLIQNFDDPFTWIRATITADTYNSGAHTGTLTTSSAPFLNAVTSKFVPSLSSFVGKPWRFYKHDTGYTSRERRLTMPNPRELWRGTLGTGAGWIDASGNGQLSQTVDDYNPDPYNLPAAPDVAWLADRWKTFEVLAVDGDGLLHRLAVAGNDAQHVGFGKSIYKVSVGGTAGTFTLGAKSSGGAGGTTAAVALGANAATLQAALAALAGMSGHVTVTGPAGGPYGVSFDAALGFTSLALKVNALTGTGAGVTIGRPDGATDLVSTFIIVPAASKGDPRRPHDTPLYWYAGAMQGVYSIAPTDDQLTTVPKPVGIVRWLERDSDNNCSEFSHLAFDIDAQISLQDDCECGRAGDYISRYFYTSPRAKQNYVLGLIGAYADLFNPFGDGGALTPRQFTPATWAYGFQADTTINTTHATLHAWASTVTYVDGSHITVSGMPAAITRYPVDVYYTIEDAHGTLTSSGIGSLSAGGTLTGIFGSGDDGLTITLWPGFTRTFRRRVGDIYGASGFIADATDDQGAIDPPAITGDGHINAPAGVTLTPSPTGGTITYNTTRYYRVTAVNGSGETDPSVEQSVLVSYCPNVCTTPPCPPNAPTRTCRTANTYSVLVAWAPVSGASSYNIYGFSSGAELLMGSVSADHTSWVDDGSITPSGAMPTSNTTHNACWGVGLWVHREPSAGYLEVDQFGYARESATAFVTGELARYMGGFLAQPNDGHGGVSTTLAPDAPYWARLVNRCHRKATQALLTNQQSGTIVSGTHYSFKTDKHWWNDTVVNTGTLRIQGGTATGGTTGTFTVSGYNAGQHACWFAGSRYAGTIGGVAATPWSGFVVELYAGGLPAGWSIDGSGTASWTGSGAQPAPDYKVPIASFAAGTFTLTAAIAAAVANGWGYLIREPKYKLNRHRGRVVTINKNDGTAPFRLPVRFNDDDTAFVDAQGFSFAAGWSWSIDEIDTNAVLQYATAAPTDLAVRYAEIGTSQFWIQPTGDDTRTGHPIPPVKFLPQLSWNLETKVIDFGPSRFLDDVVPTLLDELVYVIRCMRWTPGTPNGWQKSYDPVVGEQWSAESGGINIATYLGPDATFIPDACTTQAATRDEAIGILDYLFNHNDRFYCGGVDQFLWEVGPAETGPTGSPGDVGVMVVDETYDGSCVLTTGDVQYSIQTHSAYNSITAGCPTLTCTVSFLAYGIIPGGSGPPDGPDAGNQGTTCGPNIYTFNNHGNPIDYRRWREWSAVGGANGGLVVSGKLGSVIAPVRPAAVQPCCAADGGIGTNTEGWAVGKVAAILKWDMIFV